MKIVVSKWTGAKRTFANVSWASGWDLVWCAYRSRCLLESIADGVDAVLQDL